MAHVLAKRFRTISVSENEASLMNFVHQHPHRETMMIVRRFMGVYGIRALENQRFGSTAKLARRHGTIPCT